MGTLMEDLQDRIEDAVNSTGTFDESLQKLADLYGEPAGSNPARLISVAAEFEPSITGAPAALNYLLNNPSKLPTLGLDFISKNTLDSRITFTRALNTATYFNSAGVLTTANANVPRFDYNPTTLAARGLLIEEQRTNSIRNNTMQGAVAGTPGTLPTNWNFVAGTTGIASAVVGTGVFNGVTYIDIRYSGTAAATASFSQRVETGNSIAALTGQTWTMSAWVQIQAGTTNGITAINHQYVENTSAGGFVTSNAVPITVDSTFSRQSTSRTLSGGATVAFVTGGISVTVTSGQAIDITLRIGLPQLEQGAFATSVIPTTTTALTRNADVASVNTLSPWYNASEGTLFADFARTDGGTSDKWIANLYADANNRFEIVTGTQIRTRSVIAGVVASAGAVSAVTSGKFAAAYKASDYAGVLNGGSVGTNTGIASVITATTLGLGNAGYTTSPLNGHLRRITYYPRRLSNAELQAITA